MNTLGVIVTNVSMNIGNSSLWFDKTNTYQPSPFQATEETLSRRIFPTGFPSDSLNTPCHAV